MSKIPDMTLKAIGFVKNAVKENPGRGYRWQDVVSEIVITSNLTEALDNLDDFSHIIVLWWMHKAAKQELWPAKVHPRGDPELPLVGHFATRSPHRPNPIGKATVSLLQRQGNVLRVKGLDAIDGSPVIDIKPYIPGSDSISDARVPPWVTKR